MTPLEYREFCLRTYSAPTYVNREEYLRLMLIKEVGDVSLLFAEAMSHASFVLNDGHKVDRDKLLKELGDVMWCTACLDDKFGESKLGWDEGMMHASFCLADDLTRLAVISDSTLALSCEVQKLCFALGFSPEEVALANVSRLRGDRS